MIKINKNIYYNNYFFVKAPIQKTITRFLTDSNLFLFRKARPETMPDWFRAYGIAEGEFVQTPKFYDASKNAALEAIQTYPKTIEQCLKIVCSLHLAKQFALVHGQNAGWNISQKILGKLGYQGLQILRLPEEGSLEKSTKEQELSKMVETATKLHNKSSLLASLSSKMNVAMALFHPPWRVDHQIEYRSLLLSTTYGALHFGFKESPFSFAFGASIVPIEEGEDQDSLVAKPNENIVSHQKTEKIGTELIISAMRNKGISEKKIESLGKQLPSLYSEAFALPMGQLLVIGLPYQLSHLAYDSRPYGFPTGQPIDTKRSLKIPGQIRLMLTQEALNCKDVTVTNVMDFGQVDNYDPQQLRECMDLLSNGRDREPAEEQRAIIQWQEFNTKIDHVIATYL